MENRLGREENEFIHFLLCIHLLYLPYFISSSKQQWYLHLMEETVTKYTDSLTVIIVLEFETRFYGSTFIFFHLIPYSPLKLEILCIIAQ